MYDKKYDNSKHFWVVPVGCENCNELAAEENRLTIKNGIGYLDSTLQCEACGLREWRAAVTISSKDLNKFFLNEGTLVTEMSCEICWHPLVKNTGIDDNVYFLHESGDYNEMIVNQGNKYCSVFGCDCDTPTPSVQ
jgi:hypothetical protein